MGHSFKKCEQPLALPKPKKLSMWVLKGKKDACLSELKEIKDRGSEFAMGFEYDSPRDRKRAKELRAMIKDLNRDMQNADG